MFNNFNVIIPTYNDNNNCNNKFIFTSYVLDNLQTRLLDIAITRCKQYLIITGVKYKLLILKYLLHSLTLRNLLTYKNLNYMCLCLVVFVNTEIFDKLMFNINDLIFNIKQHTGIVLKKYYLQLYMSTIIDFYKDNLSSIADMIDSDSELIRNI